MNSLADLWQRILDALAVKLSPTTINTWFDEVSIVAVEDQALVLHCPNDFKRSTIKRRFLQPIYLATMDVFSQGLEVKVLDDDQLAAYHGVRPDHPGASPDFDKAFTFETFVAGPQNRLAYSAASSVADLPARRYNPLFIYGDSGLGKTHLLYAIRYQSKRLRPKSNVVYVKGEEFINEFIELVRSGRGDEFRAKYRDADMLLVDDIQFVAGKEQVQNEFFHTFNTLYEAGKQIVMTSDRPPREMSLLDDRLRTRFEWGLMADVAPPDYETRLAIIRNKSKILGMSLTDEIMDYIAENVTANVRQIEGILNKILAYWDLLGDQLDTESLEKAIMDTVRK
ncbi:MAG: chromosomal replication initiator protein DnaA, partial [Clostridia bacterium]|nr:chromosomal replication initiator protein DnaA [Clostridia bacterium]